MTAIAKARETTRGTFASWLGRASPPEPPGSCLPFGADTTCGHRSWLPPIHLAPYPLALAHSGPVPRPHQHRAKPCRLVSEEIGPHIGPGRKNPKPRDGRPR